MPTTLAVSCWTRAELPSRFEGSTSPTATTHSSTDSARVDRNAESPSRVRSVAPSRHGAMRCNGSASLARTSPHHARRPGTSRWSREAGGPSVRQGCSPPDPYDSSTGQVKVARKVRIPPPPHKYYIARKPFAGGDALSSGKGLRRFRASPMHDRSGRPGTGSSGTSAHSGPAPREPPDPVRDPGPLRDGRRCGQVLDAVRDYDRRTRVGRLSDNAVPTTRSKPGTALGGGKGHAAARRAQGDWPAASADGRREKV